MTKTTGTYYAVQSGKQVWLTLKVGAAGLATTDLVVGDELILRGHEGHLRINIGLADELNLKEIRCYTTVHGSQPNVPNSVEYRLTGGSHTWRALLREDPPDKAHDLFVAQFRLYQQ